MPVTDLLISSGAPVWLVDLVASLSFMTHYEGLQRGVVDSRDVIYFLSVAVFALFTNAIILRDERA
jgi:ABC-2 type transport system permease protein